MTAPLSPTADARGDSPRAGHANLYTGAERRRLNPELLVPSRARGYLQVIGNISVFVALIVLAGRVAVGWQLVLLYLAIGLALHRLFFPTHDCIHYSLFPTKAENRAAGTILSGLLGTSFDAIRDQHLDHHRDFGTKQDPGASDYYVRFRSRAQFLRFLLGPLVGSILFAKIGDYVLRPSGVSNPDPTAGQRTTTTAGKIARYGWLLAIQAGVCYLLTDRLQPGRLWRYPVFSVLPSATIFLFLVRLRMFLEHGSLNYAVCDYLEHKRPTARTIYGSFAERILICGSDFNYHHEHHLYPVVPGWQLPKLHRELRASGLDPEDVRRSYTQALLEIWRNLPR